MDFHNNPLYDEEMEEYIEELVEGDVGMNFVVRRSCLIPKTVHPKMIS